MQQDDKAKRSDQIPTPACDLEDCLINSFGYLCAPIMSSPSFQTSPSSQPPTEVVPPAYGRLRALLNLADENPSTMGYLLKEVRDMNFLIPTELGFAGSVADLGLICNSRDNSWFALSFLNREIAERYLADYGEPFQLVECRGEELLATIARREGDLGLYIVDDESGYFLGSNLVNVGVGLLNFNEAETVSVQYTPSRFSGTIPREFCTEVELLCRNYPHIERVYICDLPSTNGRRETLLAIVGDSDASSENVQDILAMIASKKGIGDWYGNVTWIAADDSEQFMIRHEIDCVYDRRKITP